MNRVLDGSTFGTVAWRFTRNKHHHKQKGQKRMNWLKLVQALLQAAPEEIAIIEEIIGLIKANRANPPAPPAA